MDESHNLFMSSRGILKLCDIKSKTPVSSIRKMINYDFKILNQSSGNETFYICMQSSMKHFYQNIEKIQFNFVLVSGDCDESMPFDILSSQEFNNLINNKHLALVLSKFDN